MEKKIYISQPKDLLFKITPWEKDNCKGILEIDFDLCKDMNYRDQRAF